ncbi:hypothetical protein AYL99_09966 [Fonsecaea erecta]|uniref:Ras-associating domain-containing protein n=1 Tax=Fonsecaea erecta TaxID=1367422 RepID=A0A178Z7Q3_9EURO|nr:hypothetical protein AYL99_09966 [Fonsecaea erecta]OAP55814.1 hypothetical protein AYL99_09966 [Fonsecaea erecta]
MAEALGLVASLANIIGAGLALSKGLYEFASVLGSASRDIKDLSTDISLFCSVLKHVQTTLTRARAFRLSMSAVQTAEDIVERCRVIFTNLQTTVDSLRKGEAKLDLLARVRWFFKEKRVLLVHEQLKTCSATLHLMLTTLMLAQKIASRRLSLDPEDDEDVQDRLMAHSLFLAQQAAKERLVTVEDEVIRDEALLKLESSPDHNSWAAFDAPSLNFEREKRVSVIVGDNIDRLSLAASLRSAGLSTLDENRLSVLQTDELLRHWTDQCDPLASSEQDTGTLLKNVNEHQDNDLLSINTAVPKINVRGVALIDPSPNEKPANSLFPMRSTSGAEQHSAPANATEQTTNVSTKPPPLQIFPILRIGLEDRCREILPDVMKFYKVQGDWRDYRLVVVCGDRERYIGKDEKPLAVYKELDLLGRQPRFLLRKMTAGGSSLRHTP